jgi:uncharacterized protein
MHDERRYSSDLHLQERRNKPPVAVGYAAIFNSLSSEMKLGENRTFREIVRPGAFAASLAGADVVARFEHVHLIGRVSNGTLRLSEDSRGLRYEVDLPNTSVGRDLLELLRRRDIAHSSFAFSVRPGGDNWRREGQSLIRELRSVQLIDVAPVARPAYPATDVALRSWQSWQAAPADCRRMRLEIAERT